MDSSLDSLLDSASQHKNTRDSRVSVYYEQDHEDDEQLFVHSSVESCCSDIRIVPSPPVEIHEENTTSIDLPPLTWHGYENFPRILSVTNTGRTILISGHWANSRPYIEGGPLNGNYLFSQIHFHCPSEHEIDGRRYPLEMHVVHYKTSYLTQERAMHEKDGTVVLVYLFKLTNACTTAISQITKLGPCLEKLNSRTETHDIALNEIIKPFSSNYYVYWGSVPTKKKPYLLQWIISCNQLCVTPQEVEDLSSIIACAGLCSNKHTPPMKPEDNAVYHVGEDDYSLPGGKSGHHASCSCICHKGTHVSCKCKWRKAKNTDIEESDGSSHVLVCSCKSKTKAHKGHSKSHRGKHSCCQNCTSSKHRKDKSCKCKSLEKICKNIKVKGRCISDTISTACFNSKKVKSKSKSKSKHRSSGKRKLNCELETNESDGVPILNCESESGTSQFTPNEEKHKKRKHKNKKKKHGNDSDSQPTSECESGKSSSKSSVPDEGKKEETKSTEHSESQPDSNSESKPANLRFAVPKEEEKKSGEKPKKRKKKKDPKVINSLETVHKTSRKHGHNKAEIYELKLTSSGPFSMSSKSSVFNDEEKPTQEKDTESPDTEPVAQCTLADESSDGMNLKEQEVSTETDNIASKATIICRSLSSKSRVNLKKLKDPETPALEVIPKTRASKSKSPVMDLNQKKKVGLRNNNERCESADSRTTASMREKSQSRIGKNKKAPDCNISQSVQEVKCPVTKAATEIKCEAKSPGDKKRSRSKLDEKKSLKKMISTKSKEEMKEKNKKGSGQENKVDCNDEITTLFEKKQIVRKEESLAGDCNDVQVNFLLTPVTKSTHSCALTTSESEFIDEKKVLEETEEKKNSLNQDFTVNPVSLSRVELPKDNLKAQSQVCLLMEHLFRTENKEGQINGCTSQEYHVAIMYEQNILQEYKGKFRPQELEIGNFEILPLTPKYPEPENSNIRLQDCTVKKESLDRICIRVKFLLKEVNFKKSLENQENRPESPDKKPKSLFDEETQYSSKELGLNKKPDLKEAKENFNDGKTSNCWKMETLKSDSASVSAAEPKKSSSNIPHLRKETTDSQQCKIKLQKNPNVHSKEYSESSDTGEYNTDSKMEKNESDEGNYEKTDKKLKPLFVKRRKTVYFMYDKVERDESSGKKVFVGSFRTKEEVESLKKQKKVVQEIESSSTREKFKGPSQPKYLLSFPNKDIDLEVVKLQTSPQPRESSPEKKVPTTSKDAPNNNKKKDVVTLHKYKPKYSGMNRFKKECKNVLIDKVVNNLQKDNENFKNLAEIIGVEKEKDPKISIYELQEAPERRKASPNPASSNKENMSRAKNVAVAKDEGVRSLSEVNEPEKSNRAEEDSAVDKSQKSLDKKESPAALILIPVEVESLSKVEVILIEHLNNIKKGSKDENSPSPNIK